MSDPAGVTRSLHDSDTDSGHLEVRCPNCRAPMDVAVDTQLTDLTCGSCGSHFSLVDQSQATRMAPPLSQMGRFELIERLGVGGFGSVWKARDKELDRTVAIKIPRQGAMTGEEQEKFFREARAAAQLRHPNIVSVHEVGRDGDSVYIVSDFVRGVTLGDWLTGQQLTSREAAELCVKIADALHHAHENGVVHRDLKPANIIIDYDGQPHLMDFGLARRDVGEITVTMDGQVLGTPAYMSPEQAQGEAHTADRRSDVYSLGVILFNLLTGELPFRGNARMLIYQVINDEPPSPRKLNANISKDLETLTLKCLEKDPNRRYQSAADLAAELKRYLAGEPILARPLGRVERGWRWARRNRRVALLTASVAVLLVAIAALSTVGFAVAKRQQLAAQQAAQREAKLRDQAEENLALAEEAVDGYLTRVAEDQRLKQGDFHNLRTELLATAVPFYERFAEQKPGDVDRETNRAKAYTRLASIHSETGQGKKALEDYEKAVAIHTSLVSRSPDDPEHKEDLASNHKTLGYNYFLRKDFAKAEKHYQQAISLYSQLAKDAPNNGAYRQGISLTRDVYGMLLKSRDKKVALREFEQALEIERQLVDDFPDIPGYKAGLAATATRIAELLQQTNPAAARNYLNEAIGIQRELIARDPKPAYRLALAEALGLSATISDAIGDRNLAQEQHQEAVEIDTQLLRETPAAVRVRRNCAAKQFAYGQFLSRIGDVQGSLEQFESCRTISEQLAIDEPDIPSHQIAVANCCMMSANLHQDDRQIKRNYEQAVAIFQKLTGESPDVAIYKVRLAGALNDLAWRLATSPDDQVRNGRQAIELATQACELTTFADSHIIDTLAAAYAEAGDFKSAVKWSEKSLEVLGAAENDHWRKAFETALANYRANKPTRVPSTQEQEDGKNVETVESQKHELGEPDNESSAENAEGDTTNGSDDSSAASTDANSAIAKPAGQE